MASYIAKKYAAMLTIDDAESLFGLLIRNSGGNRSEAARRIGVTAKTTYDWPKSTYLKDSNKEKLLNACLEANFAETVELLLERVGDRNIDLLRTTLGEFYADALEATSQEDFLKMYLKFNEIRKNNAGLIRDSIQNEVLDMEIALRNKAQQMGNTLPLKQIDDLSSKELLDIIQLIGRVYVENPLHAKSFAEKNLDLPPQTAETIINLFSGLYLAIKMQTNNTSEYPQTDLIWNFKPTGNHLDPKLYEEPFCQKTWIRERKIKKEPEREITA